MTPGLASGGSRAPAPQASIIVPTFNRVDALPRALDSAIAQTERDIEIIVVDDGSTDGTRGYLAGVHDPRIQVLHQENAGPGAARNRGLAAARAPIVAFLDSDDRYRPERIAVALRVFAQEPDVVCTLSAAFKVDRSGIQTASVTPAKLPPPAFRWAILAALINVEGSGITARRDAALAAGGFNPALRRNEDSDFLVRLTDHGALRLLPEILWEKFWSANALTADLAHSGQHLLAYVQARPELTGSYLRIGAYIATRSLVRDLRARRLDRFAADWRAFKAAGLLPGSPAALWRNHRLVRNYRKKVMAAPAEFETLRAPEGWDQLG